jgi:hypothetical protein
MASGPFVSCKTLIGQLSSAVERVVQDPNRPRLWIQVCIPTLTDPLIYCLVIVMYRDMIIHIIGYSGIVNK